jgi:hypothetical protein
MKKIKKTIYVLNINNYGPALTKLTYPFIEFYADKIGADVYTITERKFPDMPVTYEKLQIYELAKKHGNDWNIYIDSDTLVNPILPDVTQMIPKDTVMHWGEDSALIRWRYDEYFMRDGRNISSCNWFTVASDWCVDLWKPIDDLTLQEILENIQPTSLELELGITKEHLIDDYTLSRNIAKFGLKHQTIKKLREKFNIVDNFLYHTYEKSLKEKTESILNIIKEEELGWFLANKLKNVI